ncbi:MAG: class I SAM-dependent methyltransferase [Burkholderiales bacterium]|nr:class I SAM-dependent methyltransferase [Burkholderiales bacterium]
MNEARAIERLAERARLSWDLAPRLCKPDTGCCNYHRCWSMVRLLGSGGALPGSHEFFIEHIAALAQQGARRVLVSGAADTGLATIVLLASKRAGVPLQVVVAERCETPLLQNRRLADEQGVDAEFHLGDIRDLQCEPVDIVMAHSFLLFFPEPMRQQVIDTWARVCKPGATALLFSHVVEREDQVMLHVDQGNLEERVTNLCNAAMSAGWQESERNDIAASVRRFWTDARKFAAAPSTTAQNLHAGFSKAGFDVLQVEPRQPPSSGNGPVGLGTTMPATRAELIARRRNA